MADLKFTRLVIDGNTYAIPTAAANQNGLMTSTDFTKLQNIAANAQVNVLECVKVNNVALSIAGKIVKILIGTGSVNGTISVQNVDIPVKGLAALAYKAKVSQADLEAALTAVINAKAESSEVNTISNKIDVLNGTGTGSVKKAIDDAFNDFSTKVTDDGVINSYKELIDWAAAHGGDAAEMAASITQLEGLLDGIGGEGNPATVMTAINTAINSLDFYTKAETTAKLNTKVDKKSGYNLSKNDFTDALLTKLNSIEANATANKCSYDAASQTLTLTGFSTE